jgi:leucyl-tRNA synthetase
VYTVHDVIDMLLYHHGADVHTAKCRTHLQYVLWIHVLV